MHTHFPAAEVARRRARGFTVTELLVVLAIGAVLAGVAAPAFRSTLVNYRIEAASSALLDSLLLAREEARNSASPVSVCTSNDGATCTDSPWRDGHIVFRDAGTAGAVDAGDTVLNRTVAASAGISTSAKLQQSGADFTRGYLQFGADGKLDVRTALVFATCQSGHKPLLTAVQYNGATSSSKGATPCT
ncbi:MAG: GspH/FimT family pseudopilin [Pseudomonadota bacterium]